MMKKLAFIFLGLILLQGCAPGGVGPAIVTPGAPPVVTQGVYVTDPPTARPATETSSPSPIPTDTPGATATAVLIINRITFTAAYMSNRPVIDGDWREWSATLYPVEALSAGEDKWMDGNDLSASFRTGWDLQNLYIAVKVKDDTHAPSTDLQHMDQGDAVILYFDSDLRGDFPATGMGLDDFSIGFQAGQPGIGDTPRAYQWTPGVGSGQRGDIQVAATPYTKDAERGYYLEAAIPWSVLSYQPQGGQEYGFVLAVTDADDTNQITQQSVVTSVLGWQPNNPTTWGMLSLGR